RFHDLSVPGSYAAHSPDRPELTMSTPVPLNAPSESLVTTTHIVYALHTLGLVIGTFGTATVIGTFLFGWPSIIAVIINYVKRSEVRGTWLDSHFSWQIRTFWWALLWAVIIGLVGFVLSIVIVGIAIWIIGFFLLGIWAIYRIARGWLRLKDRQPMPIP
ncbi:MAG: hypothetical protein ABW318_12515, partial [Vicinamibacterales bacterium]